MNIQQIQAWLFEKNLLDTTKLKELKARKEICDELFKGRQGVFTEKLTLEQYVIKASSKVTLSIDADLLESMYDDFTDDERACFVYKPNLVASALKKIPSDSKVFDVITEKPATPSLEIKVVDL